MKTYQIILAVIISLVAANSCNKWLQLEPYDGVVEEDYWQTKEHVHAVVIGCYSSLLNNSLMRSLIYWGELRADIMTPGNAKEEEVNVMRGEINPDISIVDWSRMYATINQCNKVIERSANVRLLDKTFSETLYRQYLAEATTIRSLMYFYLVRSFQNVPLVLKATDSDNQNFYVPNSEGAAILDTLVKHLEIAREHVPINYGNNDQNKGRITRWSAMALLADIYLWQGNYAACRDLCTQIIGSGQFTLVPVEREQVAVYDDINPDEIIGYVHHVNIADADNLFDQLYVTGNCIESIFELQFPKTHETLGNAFDDFFYAFSGRPRMMAKTEVLDQIIFPQYEGDDREVFDVRGNNFSYKSGSGYVWKYWGTSRGNTMRGPREFPHWIVYRLPDVILMKAEALNQIAIQTDNQQMMNEAYDLVMQIRDRSNAVETLDTKLSFPINGKSLERLILNERAREFTFEGKRWFDVLRFARRDNYAGINRNYLMELAINSTTPDKVASLQTKYNNNWFHYWPIGTSAINTNPNLTQNDFYQQSK